MVWFSRYLMDSGSGVGMNWRGVARHSALLFPFPFPPTPPDPGWPFTRSCRSTSNPRARSRWPTRSSSAPAAETGLVQLVMLRFMFIRQDCGACCRSQKSPSTSACYGRSRPTGLYSVFVPEAGECKLLTMTGPLCPCCRVYPTIPWKSPCRSQSGIPYQPNLPMTPALYHIGASRLPDCETMTSFVISAGLSSVSRQRGLAVATSRSGWRLYSA